MIRADVIIKDRVDAEVVTAASLELK